MPIRNEWLEAKASGYRPVRVGRRQAMPWVVGIIVAGMAVAGIWALANYGTLAAPGTSQVIEEPALTLDELRTRQVLASSVFEVVPGEVLEQGRTRVPPGDRYDMRVRVRNLDEARTLQNAFWNVSAVGFDAGGKEVPVTVQLPEWGSFGREGSGVSPEGQLTGTIILIGEGLKSFAVTWEYSEPGRTAASASFVWPYGK